MKPRWNTFEPGIKSEERQRAQLSEQIGQWWSSFEDRASELEALFQQKTNWDLAAWMQENLQAIEPNLMWEFGPGLNGGQRLVITPEHRFELRPLVNEVLRRSPTIEGWSFYGHRLPESYDQALAIVEGRTGAALAATGFKCSSGRFNLVDLTIEFPKSFLRNNTDLAFSQAFVLAESLLGEEILNAWVGELHVTKKPWGSSDLRRLPLEVASVQGAIVDRLPDSPLCAASEQSKWTLLEVEPQQADDYPAQSDIFVGKAMNTEQWENGHKGAPYFSERYSKVGEIFCYLKMDGSESLDEEIFEDKGDIEDALDDALRPKGLGCFVSGGTGYRYSYVDLALTDLKAAISVVREVLQAGRLTKRSWLLFYDDEWANEWVGIWPDSPPPPLVSEAE